MDQPPEEEAVPISCIRTRISKPAGTLGNSKLESHAAVNSSHHDDSLCDGWCLADFEGGRLRNIGSELRSKLGHVVGKECRLVASAREGDVAKAGVEQVRVNTGISMNENALGGETLGAMAGNGISVVEVAVLAGVELNLPVIVQAGRKAAIGMDRLYDGKVTVGDSE